MLPIWIWIVFIIIGALLICLFAYFWSKKNLFKQKFKSVVNLKWLSKESREKRKQKKLAKKQEPAKAVVKEIKEEDKVSFDEKHAPQVLNDAETIEGEVYEPSTPFESHPDFYTTMPRSMSQFGRHMPPRFRREMPVSSPNFSRRVVAQKGNIREQINQLSPEMKAIIFANVLDSKLDEDDKF